MDRKLALVRSGLPPRARSLCHPRTVSTDEDAIGVGHAHVHEPPAIDAEVARSLWTVVVACAVVTIVAVIAMWPRGDAEFEDPLLLDADPIAATAIGATLVPCSFGADETCTEIEFELTEGSSAGLVGTLAPTAESSVSVGDGILLIAFESDSGGTVYTFFDHQRGTPMLWLLALFVVAVVALGRWRGVGAIAGLAFSLFVIVQFTLPAILDGRGAFPVALATAALIAFAALFLAHGVTIATAVSLLSTFASLITTAVLASIFVGATHLTGLANDSGALLGGLGDGIDPRGILLAGIVIGALGVLDDVTVTQVAAVWELKRLRPELTRMQLVRPALRIGRDHISSTVNTLFLAYAGAALPLLLLFARAGQGVGDVVTRELVATEVVRAMVGSIGLVAAVPAATWLAAIVVAPPDADADGHEAAPPSLDGDEAGIDPETD